MGSFSLVHWLVLAVVAITAREEDTERQQSPQKQTRHHPPAL